ncbi:hypothetical protein K450DRAFT_239894 [Umbelopsis ramanniana AG]|uniref:Ribonuclease H n=1 Tax=Umbelopsis ramanniana AG TaxID=1314678 RepID=A0AAD5EBJ6_UMBRA|nr:uncharacterized protein K450DRAFT_239894 [Umbelopsis ramanniana AG]KAI8579956.1 hypothetical protein K450DRAFT_239894 [Umbelopsis ramanniana AG]
MPKAARTYYYAVRVGKKPGIYTQWSDCEKQVIGYPNSRYKKFVSKQEADDFLSATESKGNSSTSRKHATTTNFAGTSKDTSGDTKIGIAGSKIETKTEREEKVALKDEGMIVYTDGAASGNGTSKAYAGIGVYWGPNDKSEPLEGKPTNQRAEIQAVIRAIETCGNDKSRLNICTDSMYTVNAVKFWRKAWEKNKWKTSSNKDIQNEDLFRRLFHLIDTRPGMVVLKHVRGHQGVDGNVQADQLAVNGAMLSANNKKSPDNVIK